MGNSNSCIYNYCKAEDGKGQEKRAEDSVTLPGDSSKQTLLTYLIDCWIKI